MLFSTISVFDNFQRNKLLKFKVDLHVTMDPAVGYGLFECNFQS